MRTFIASCLIGGALAFGGAGGTFAAPEPTAPPPPGGTNCHGQTVAAVAQLGKYLGLPPQELRGIGGLSHDVPFSAREIQQSIVAYCAGEPLP